MTKNNKFEEDNIFKEEEPIINMPYRVPLGQFLREPCNFDIKIIERNGEKPLVLVRHKIKEN